MQVWLALDGSGVASEHRLLQDLHERIGNLRQGAEGRLYVPTDSAIGLLIRLEH